MKWTDLLNSERPSGTRFQENEALAMSPFERDYYTIITSSYFRRLQNKTQVYTLDESDFIRTRLTHSLEVSSIGEILGKRLAARIRQEHPEDLPENFEEDLPMVLRCAGLLHDFGNPPFGHSGEKYIRDYFLSREGEMKKTLTEQMWLDLINFDGNAHNIRIVTKLGQSSNPCDRQYGMDLTCAVINSLIKYPFNSLPRSARKEDGTYEKRGKIGYYHSEEWIIAKPVKGVMAKTGCMNAERVVKKNPIMLLMEASDDIAYATADVEDAIKKGKIDPAVLKRTLPEEEREQIDGGIGAIQILLKRVREKSMVDVINYFMDHYDDIMNDQTGECELISGCSYRLTDMKELLYDFFGERDKLSEYKHNTNHNISRIMDTFLTILSKPEEERNLREMIILSEMEQYLVKGREEVDYQSWLTEEEMETEYLYHRYMSVVDFVSGMTDSYVKIFLDRINDEDYFKTEITKMKVKLLSDILTTEVAETAEHLMKKIGKIDNWSNLEISNILHACLYREALGQICPGNDTLRALLGKYRQEKETILSADEFAKITRRVCGAEQ